ncbi:proteasome subunit alpha [Candidatus Poribacteria bacterium]|nr:proteasome subunit alpha [Candidatus Poribacteria bacterium]
MFDEPARWLQSIENRIQYVEGRLRKGSPAVGLPFANGAVLFTVCPKGQRKVYEVYDRLALAAIGHPADVERLRMMAIDLAHTEGFMRSADDVTLQRLLHFGIAPQVKTAFDEMWRAPIIAKMLMVELAPNGSAPQFFTLNYDGNFQSRSSFGVAAGTPEAEESMEEALRNRQTAAPTLSDVLMEAARAWAVGYHVATKDYEYEEPPMPTDRNVADALAEARESMSFEAAVLDTTLSGKAKYRRVTEEELAILNAS